jgi:hypothetical protein
MLAVLTYDLIDTCRRNAHSNTTVAISVIGQLACKLISAVGIDTLCSTTLMRLQTEWHNRTTLSLGHAICHAMLDMILAQPKPIADVETPPPEGFTLPSGVYWADKRRHWWRDAKTLYI